MEISTTPPVLTPEPATAAPQKPPRNEKLMQVAEKFEAIFVGQMVAAMRKTINHDNGFIPQSHAEKMYQGMLDSEYSQRMAESRQIGLSDTIYQHLLRGR